MTEPTDAKIMREASKVGGLFDDLAIGYQSEDILKFARAVLAKWGTPPAVEGEPECTCSAKDAPFGTCCKVRSAFERWYDEQNYGRLQPFDVFKGGWIERHRLSSTPQPTQAQAGAVPLTEDQRSDIATAAAGFNWTDDYVEAIDYVIDGVESLHGIKGGQHGTE